uniref:Lectin/glucanase superfamily protein n=1 Tax=viral metagenome TaxID=1070528 RepID=A0A6C0AZU6_9ZZZZ
MDINTSQRVSTGRGSGIKDYMNSSSIIARVSFLLIVIIAFVIILQFSISILAWLFGPSSSPKLINGMVDAKQTIIIPQDPTTSGAKTINRSVNGPDGIEFTWSVWVFIDDTPSSQYRHIFSKGNADTVPETGLNFPNNAPGLYIEPNTNALTVIMNTYNNINEEVTIRDIPLNKWVNVIIRCKNTTLDVYINGTITKSLQLTGVPKQNYGDVYVAMNGGFSGYISNLWYYDYALGTTAIYNLAKNGPNTKMVGSSAMSMKNPNYLSVRWFFAGAGDQFNPMGTRS